MSNSLSHLSFNSPIGALTVFAEADAIIVLESGRAPDPGEETPLLREARQQLDAYFDGKLEQFNLPLNPHGTDHQRAVWEEMRKIPYGQTWTYGELAGRMGSVARAVGGACGANPIPVIIPCHRVMGAKDSLTGFSFPGGLETKQQLLRLEGALLI